MARRAVCLAAALLVCACSVGPLGSAPSFGIIVVTAGNALLRGGADDIPPRLNLRLHAQTAFQASDVSATLDKTSLPLHVQAGDALGSLAQSLPLGSQHHLDIAVQGRADHLIFDFSVVRPTSAMFAAHLDATGAPVVDGSFDGAPDQKAVAAAIPGATLTWADPTYVHLRWAGPTPAAVDLPATLPTAEDSCLVAPLHLPLGGLSKASLRRVTVPAAPSRAGIPLQAFSIDTGASNTSVAHHIGDLSAVSPTGWSAASDGTLLGNPDPSAVERARAHSVPIWPLVANDSTDPPGTSALLGSPSAVSQVISSIAQSVANAGYDGVHLDFEGVDPGNRDGLTAFVRALADALHKVGAKLAVDIVPHGMSGTNRFSAAYDVKAIGQTADVVDVMTYDEHGNGGSPGPVAGLDWQTAELAATLPDLQPARTLLGIPFYARRWDSSGGHSDSYSAAVAYALGLAGAEVHYDFKAQTPFIRSDDGSVTYFDDADSLARKLALVHADGLAGAAAWRLGYEDPAFWSQP